MTDYEELLKRWKIVGAALIAVTIVLLFIYLGGVVIRSCKKVEPPVHEIIASWGG